MTATATTAYSGPAIGISELAARYRLSSSYVRNLLRDADIDVGKRRILMPVEVSAFVATYGHW